MECYETPDVSEDEQQLDPVGSSAIPVGITIAYKRKKDGVKDEKVIHHTHHNTKDHSNNSSPNNKKISSKGSSSSKSTSFQVFLESSTIYILCLVLPTIIGYLYNWYDGWKYEREINTGNNQLTSQTLFAYMIANSSTIQYISENYYEPTLEYLCDDSSGSGGGGNQTNSYIWSHVSSIMSRTGLCVKYQHIEEETVLLSADVTAWSDVFTITICSFLLAFIRIAIVRYSVPLEDAETLETMVRCKSIHLLSSDYILTPAATPKASRRTTAVASQQLPSFNFPDLNNEQSEQDEMFGYNIDVTSERDEDPPIHNIQSFATGVPVEAISSDDQLHVIEQDHNQDYDSPEDDARFDSSDDELFGNALLQRLSVAAASSSAADNNELKVGSRTRKYAAPRYATALFRLWYSTVAAVIALVYFRDADFWPWYVYGNGTTSKCWDLSGGLTVGMDSDFDQRNSVLKRYFLWQASYHCHSGAFHILSLLILLLHPTKHTPHRFLSFQNSTTAYVRSLAQHALAIALIAIAYIFSSLRRLGAIGLFAFDVSSWFLHLLQVCINAPDQSRWRKSTVVSRVYWLLVIPSFTFTRFFVWPALWYSAAFESSKWLSQLEKTLWIGAAAQLRNILHLLMAIALSFTIVYFRRLLNHPHLQGVRRRKKKGTANTTNAAKTTTKHD